MKLPRDVGGHELARALMRFGYAVSRQSGSHMRLTSSAKGIEHHVTIPAHDPLRVGTFCQILNEVATYLEISRGECSLTPCSDRLRWEPTSKKTSCAKLLPSLNAVVERLDENLKG